MGDRIATATTRLAGRLKDHASKTVTIQRGAQSTAGVSATIGRTLYEPDNGAGIIDRWESRDFLIDAADYKIGGVAVLPLRGDKIIEVIGSTTVTYEVSAPRDVPHCVYADGYRVKLRIHTQQSS